MCAFSLEALDEQVAHDFSGVLRQESEWPGRSELLAVGLDGDIESLDVEPPGAAGDVAGRPAHVPVTFANQLERADTFGA